MTTYYKAVFADGRTVTRSTADRTYTHALRSGSFCGSERLARNAAKGAEIAPAVEITRQEYKAINLAEQRARLARCHEEGRQAWKKGSPRTSPYSRPFAEAWLEGWDLEAGGGAS